MRISALITKELEKDSTTMCEARSLFDGVLSEFPEMRNRLSVSSNIMGNKLLEAATIKVQVAVRQNSRQKSPNLSDIAKIFLNNNGLRPHLMFQRIWN